MSNSDSIQVIGAGFVTVDIIKLFSSASPQWKQAQQPHIYCAGGTAGNIICYLSQLGWTEKTLMMGSLGDDVLASVIRKELDSFGINTDGLWTFPGLFTRRISHLIVNEGLQKGKHDFWTKCFKCNSDFPMFPPPNFSELQRLIRANVSPDTVLVIDRANKFTLQLAEIFARVGAVILFEPGYVSRQEKIVFDILKLADILKYSHKIKWPAGLLDGALGSAGCRQKLRIMTRGPDGVELTSYISSKPYVFSYPEFPLQRVFDAAGAGDAFTAGFLSGLKGEDLRHIEDIDMQTVKRAIMRGQALGALACFFLGSKGLLYAKKRSEIERAIDYTLITGRVVENFGVDKLPKGIEVPLLTSRNFPVCEVCRLPLNQPQK